MKDLLKRELITWLQYFLITCIAAVVGHYAWDSSEAYLVTGSAGNAVAGSGGNEINIWQMVLHMWRDYFRWILGTFLALSAIRLVVVLFLARKS